MSVCPHCEQPTASGRASGHFSGHHFICDLALTEARARRLATGKYKLLRERHFRLDDSAGDLRERYRTLAALGEHWPTWGLVRVRQFRAGFALLYLSVTAYG